MHTVDQGRCDAGLVRCEFKNATCTGTQRPCRYGSVNVDRRARRVAATRSSTASARTDHGRQRLRAGAAGRRSGLFGFGADTGIDLPFEFDGTVPDKALKKRYAELGVISEDEGRGYYAGDNVQLAIGQGLLSATPLQLAVGYATIANRRLRAQAADRQGDLEPGRARRRAGLGRPRHGHDPRVVRQARADPPDPDAGRGPAADRATACAGSSRRAPASSRTSTTPRPARTCSTTTRTTRSRSPARPAPPRAPTTTRGTTRRCSPRSASTRRSPYVVTAYLEKSGYGSQAAAPVVKCMFLALSGMHATRPGRACPIRSTSTARRSPRPRMQLADTSCWNGKERQRRARVG